MTKTEYTPHSLHHKMIYMVERLKQPATIWKIVLFVFWLGMCYASLNYRITALEEFQDEVDIIWIKTTLVKIQGDIEWIKNDLSSKK